MTAMPALAIELEAESVMYGAGQKSEGKIFISNDKVRIETQTEAGRGISISRMDKRVAWMLIEPQHMYMEAALDPLMAAATSERSPGEVERKFLGNEIMNGRPVKKYRIVVDNGGKKTAMLTWIDERIGFPVKTMCEDNTWSVEYKNIKTGPLDPGLFEIPPGYNKFSMSGLMNSAMQNRNR
jgi:hypothetical protein